MKWSRFALAIVAVVVVPALSGCNEKPEGDWRWFKLEFKNDTSDEFVDYWLTAYVRDSPTGPPREIGGSRVRGPDMGPNGSLPGKHDEHSEILEAWVVYSFEAYLNMGSEFKAMPVDATKCPGVDPVTFSVRAYDAPLGGVAYDYNLNCP